MVIADLCALLELEKPDPPQDDTCDNAYVFARRIACRREVDASRYSAA